jgi:hypothetical protein
MPKYEFALIENYLSDNFSNIGHSSQVIQKYIIENKLVCAVRHRFQYKLLKSSFKFVNQQSSHSLIPLHEVEWNSEETRLYQSIIEDISLRLGIAEKELNLKIEQGSRSKLIIYFQQVIQPSNIGAELLSYLVHCHIIKAEFDRVKLSIKNTVFNSFRENEVQHFINKTQSIISHLCFQYIHKVDKRGTQLKSKEDLTANIQQIVYEGLFNLMLSIETQYFNYIDVNIEIPYRTFMLSDSIDQAKLSKVKEVLLTMPMDKLLLKSVYNPLVKMSALTQVDKITYRELMYYVFYVKEIYAEIDEYKEDFNASKLILLLNAINYNPLSLFYYKVGLIQEELNSQLSAHDKINTLFHYLKQYNQRLINTQLAFNPNLPPLNIQISKWIEEEINYLQRTHNLEESTAETNNQNQHQKITTNLSVSQLAYFLKLLVETNILEGSNQNHILRFVSTSVRTTKVEDISFKSLSSKYYNTEQTTKQSIKEHIIKLLNQVNKK